MIFHEMPDDFHLRRCIHIVLCIVEAEQELLLLRRRPDLPERQAGKWGIPGGTLEEYEALDAIWRELGEETGLWLDDKTDLGEPLTLYGRYVDPDGKGKDFTFNIFRLSLELKPNIKLNPEEHIAFCWATLQKALLLPLVRDQDQFLKLYRPEIA